MTASEMPNMIERTRIVGLKSRSSKVARINDKIGRAHV